MEDLDTMAMTPAPTAPPAPQPPPARFAVFDGDLDDAWLALYGGARALAVDTEAMGLVHGRDRLCLGLQANFGFCPSCTRFGFACLLFFHLGGLNG